MKIPTNISSEVLAKYSIDRTNLSFSVTPKDNPKDRIQVELGDSKDPTTFQPQFKLMRWDNEVNCSVRLKDFDNYTLSTEAEKIKLVTPTKEVHLYDLPIDENNPEGAYEFNLVLKEKPPTDKIEFTLNTKGLGFFYQPALTQQEIDQGTERPENVEGSYAVYHKTKGGMNDAAGMEYKVGKAFHIYRPKVTDADGKEIWGELNIDVEKGELIVTVDQKFLDNAVYPVVVDPTFGFIGVGASTSTIANGSANQCGRVGYGSGLNTTTAAGTLDSFNAALKLSGAGSETVGITTFMNDENTATDSHAKVASVDSDKTINSTTASWFTFTAASEAMAADTYLLNIVGNHNDISGTLSIRVMYDSIRGNVAGTFYSETFQGAGGDTDYANSQEDPWTATDSVTGGSYIYSLYVTYTPTASQTVTLYYPYGTYTWTAPTGVTSITVKAWGGGGGGYAYDSATGGAGGGGGAYASSIVAVTPTTGYTVTVGDGGSKGNNGVDSQFIGDDKTVLADAGTGATSITANGVGGTLAGSTGDTEAAGGPGGDGTTDDAGGGGGGAGGPHGTGGTGANAVTTAGGAGGAGDAGSGGTAGTGGANGVDGGDGGFSLNGGGGGGGAGNGRYGGDGGFPGGGGGGSEYSSARNLGASGLITITYTAPAGGGETVNVSWRSLLGVGMCWVALFFKPIFDLLRKI